MKCQILCIPKSNKCLQNFVRCSRGVNLQSQKMTRVENILHNLFMFSEGMRFCLFACVDALRPSEQIFSHACMISCLPRLNNTKQKCLAQGL